MAGDWSSTYVRLLLEHDGKVGGAGWRLGLVFTGFGGEADDCDVRGAELSNEGHSTHRWRGQDKSGKPQLSRAQTAQEQGIVPRQQTVELCCETRDFCHCGPFHRKRNGEALEINRNAVPQVVCESPSRSLARPSLCLTVTQALSQ